MAAPALDLGREIRLLGCSVTADLSRTPLTRIRTDVTWTRPGPCPARTAPQAAAGRPPAAPRRVTVSHVRIREDGRKLHPAYLLEAKTPQESKGDWDLLKLVATTPADEAFRPLAEGHCSFIKA